MRRYLALALALLILLPVAAESTGTLTIPVVFGNLAGPSTQSLSLFDTTFNAVRDYINNREITQDLSANRPAAGVKGRWYFATNLNGGTLYNDTGSAWTQVAGSVQGALAEQFTGLTLSNGVTNPSSTIGIAAGGASSDDATITARVMMILPSAFTKTTATWVAGTAAGCLDTGTVAASTWYSVFLIQRTDTGNVDVLCSASATAPVMPTNYTKKRRLGSILTDASVAINFFTQRAVFWFTWATPSALNVNQTNPGSPAAAVTATATTPNGVVTQALLNVSLENGSTANLPIYFSALSDADLAPSNTATPLTTAAQTGLATPAHMGGQTWVWTNTAQAYRFRTVASGASDVLRIVTVGWYDPLRN
jgi:hypothetical protein